MEKKNYEMIRDEMSYRCMRVENGVGFNSKFQVPLKVERMYANSFLDRIMQSRPICYRPTLNSCDF